MSPALSPTPPPFVHLQSFPYPPFLCLVLNSVVSKDFQLYGDICVSVNNKNKGKKILSYASLQLILEHFYYPIKKPCIL